MDTATALTLAAAVVVVTTALAVALVATAGRRRLARELTASQVAVEALRERVDALDRSREVPVPAASAPQEFVITSLPAGTVSAAPAGAGDALENAAQRHLTAGQLASVAVGESVVRLLSLGYGVRRALSAENRDRIRVEVRREVKRARKQRRRDLKEAKRHLRTVATRAEDAA